MDNDKEILAALNHHWEAAVALDIDRAHDIYHDDVIVEFPQSGERISGKHNIYELRKHYPAKLTFKIMRVRGEGSLWVTEYIITYDGGHPLNVEYNTLVTASPMIFNRIHRRNIDYE